MFLGESVLKKCSKFTGEHPCRKNSFQVKLKNQGKARFKGTVMQTRGLVNFHFNTIKPCRRVKFRNHKAS